MHPPELLTASESRDAGALLDRPALPPDRSGPGRADGSPAIAAVERRRPSISRISFRPEPRRIRELLAEVDSNLLQCSTRERRQVRLLVGEIVARLLALAPKAPIELAVEVKPNSVRLDAWTEPGAGPCDFFERLEDAVFLDLASNWGRDRRRPCGAWFEIRYIP